MTMPHLGAPIGVLVLRCVILGGLVSADPSIVPFIHLSTRSLLFWSIVISTVALYLKASFADPGFLKTCPSRYVYLLSLKGLIKTVPDSQLKGVLKKRQKTTQDGGVVKEKRIQQGKADGGSDGAAGPRRDRLTSNQYGAPVDGHWASHKTRRQNVSNRQGPFLGRKSRVQYDLVDSDDSWSIMSNEDTSPGDGSNIRAVADFSCEDPALIDDTSVSPRLSCASCSSSVVSSDTNLSDAFSERRIEPVEDVDIVPNIQLQGADEGREENWSIPVGHGHDIELGQISSASPKRRRDGTEATTVGADDNGSDSDILEMLYSEADALEEGRLTPLGYHLPQMDVKKPERSRRLVPLQQRLGKLGVPIHPGSSTSATVGTVLTFAAGTAVAPAVFVSVAASQLVQKARHMPWSWSENCDSTLGRACGSWGNYRIDPFHTFPAASGRRFASKVKVDKEEDEESGVGITENVDTDAQRSSIRVRAVDQPPDGQTVQQQQRRKVQKPVGLKGSHSSDPLAPLPSAFKAESEATVQHCPASSPAFPGKSSAMPRNDVRIGATTKSLLCPLAYRDILGKTKKGRPCQTRVELRFCDTCSKFQPLRTKHCVDCGDCVRTMDHHCPWLGTCVGENNRCFFYWFLVLQALELGWTMAEVFVALISLEYIPQQSSVGTAISLQVYLIVEMIVMMFLLVMVFCLLGYHTFLAAANMTTWENIAWKQISYLRDLPEQKGSPFSRGTLQNLYIYCCPVSLPKWVPSFSRYDEVRKHGPEGEVIWEYGEQQRNGCLVLSSCCDSD